LLNLDYDGRGLARNYFCEGNKYGTITELDAVFIKPLEMINEKQLLKYAVFCFNNHASDLALDALKKAKNCGILNVDKDLPLIKYLANEFILMAKKLEHSPYNVFEVAVYDFEYIFETDYPFYHKYYSK